MTEERKPPVPPRRDSADPQRPTPRDQAKKVAPRPELDPTRTQDAAGHGKTGRDKAPRRDETDPGSDGLEGPDPVSTDRSL